MAPIVLEQQGEEHDVMNMAADFGIFRFHIVSCDRSGIHYHTRVFKHGNTRDTIEIYGLFPSFFTKIFFLIKTRGQNFFFFNFENILQDFVFSFAFGKNPSFYTLCSIFVFESIVFCSKFSKSIMFLFVGF
uniref:Uncharacterized protein n=1 Tax=Cacopsylla melanoneura TaxID=428564 RepID=A0A8D8RER8_9HEMI